MNAEEKRAKRREGKSSHEHGRGLSKKIHELADTIGLPPSARKINGHARHAEET